MLVHQRVVITNQCSNVGGYFRANPATLYDPLNKMLLQRGWSTVLSYVVGSSMVYDSIWWYVGNWADHWYIKIYDHWYVLQQFSWIISYQPLVVTSWKYATKQPPATSLPRSVRKSPFSVGNINGLSPEKKWINWLWLSIIYLVI